MTQRISIAVGVRVQMRKAHPCGGDEWTITRGGADVGLICARCGRRIMLEREEFERRVKQILSFPADADDSAATTASTAGETIL